MIQEFLKNNIKSNAAFVEYGYGQVEPNHLSAQYTGQIYAQLPAAADINVLENGQFVKYDYAAKDADGNPTGGLVNFDGKGEWMLVFNEIKLYRDHQLDCEFAMVKDNYNARIYSPMDGVIGTNWNAQSRHYNGETINTQNADGTYRSEAAVSNSIELMIDGKIKAYEVEDVTAGPDMYELRYNEDPFHFESKYVAKRMPEGTKMVPRVFKTNVGDIFTTNMIDNATVQTGDLLAPCAKRVDEKGIATGGILSVISDEEAETAKMVWQVVKVYTMPDGQKGAKIMRIA